MKLRFFLLFLLLATPVAAADFDLGRVNFPDPVIKVTYNEPVQVLDAQTNLIYLDTNTGIGLDYNPTVDDEFANEFEISPSAGELAEGDYSFEIVARSTLGLTNTIPETVEFSVTGLKAVLLSPASGFASTTPYDVELMTFVYGEDDDVIPFNAECKYYLGQNPPNDFNANSLTEMTASNPSGDSDQYSGTGVGTKHTIQDLETTSSTLSVLCQRYKLSGAVVPRLLTEQFEIGTITQGPELDVTINPPTVFNEQDPTTSIVVDTNQETSCEITGDQTYSFGDAIQADFDTYETQHVDFISYDNDEGINEIITSTEKQEKEYTIKCTNKAGLSTQEGITIVIDYGASIEISVIEPEPLTNADPVVVRAQTNIFADCELDEEFMNQDGTIHERQVTTAPSQDYTTTITCTQGEKSTTITHNFTTDRVAPTNIEINASESVCGDTATAFFTAEDNDQVHGFNWTLKDGDTVLAQNYSTSGQAEVNVPQLTSEELTWEVDVHDRAGNIAQANPVTVTIEELNSDVCNPGPFIQYHEPELGFDTEAFDPTIKTKREAVCGFRLNIPGLEPDEGSVVEADSSDGLLHELDQTITSNQELVIRCVEDDGTNHTKVLDFGIITQRPKITLLEADPNPINDFQSRETTITATTSTETVCQLVKDTTTTFDGEEPTDENTYREDHEHTLDLSHITSMSSQVLDYTVSCTDKAGQVITKPLPVTVDFSNTQIEVLSPKNYTKDSQPDVIVRPSATSVCEYRDPDSSIGGTYNQMTADSEGVHSAGLVVTLDEGAHSILVRCTNSLGDLSLKTISFTVDTTAPVMNLTGNDFVCKDASMTTEFGITDDSPVTTQVTIDGNTTNTTADRYELESTPYNGSVTIEFTPIDAAGNAGTSETRTITIHEKDALACTDPAVCGDGEVHETEECDDGNLNSSDGCSDTCKIEEGFNESVCGNGEVEAGEECDGTNIPISSCKLHDPELTGTIDSCNDDCTYDTSTCDGVLSGPEPEPEPQPPQSPDQTPPEDTTSEEVEEGFPWLALILIILGTMLMGGSGYYLYVAHESKPRNQPQNPPPMTPQMQQQNAMSLEEQKRLEREKLEAYRQREQEREAKREKIMSSFDDGSEDAQSKTENKTNNTKPEKKATEKTETEKSSDEKSSKKSDAFDKLDDLVDETKGGK